MKSTSKLLALVLAAALAGPVAASQLSDSVTNSLSRMGLDTSRVVQLTPQQVTEIAGILSNADDTDGDKKQAINLILNK